MGGRSGGVASLVLLSLLARSGGAAPAGHPQIDPTKAEVSCDAILEFAYPELCELQVVSKTLVIKGLNLVYWRYASNTITDTRVPVVMVHGGPGVSHTYMLPLKQQACRGREVVFYDQVGAGASSKPEDPRRTAPWLFTVEYYVEELSTLVDELGWTHFHFVGNSWGTIVGQAYAFSQDARLRAVVLSGPLSDSQLYEKSQWDEDDGSLGSLPHFTQATLRELGVRGAYDSALYQAEASILTSFFTVRTSPLPDCFKASAPTSNTSTEIYVGMQGASEFVVGGVLAFMNFTPRLHEIRNPVLLTHGRYDTMRPAVVNAMYNALPRAWRALMPRSGHCSMIDDPRRMNDLIGQFLDHEEAGTLDQFLPPPEPVGAVPEGRAATSLAQPWLLALAGASIGAAIGVASTLWFFRGRCCNPHSNTILAERF